MAYLQALSGIARSGVTYASWTHPAFVVTVGGTTRSVVMDGWAITDQLSAPSVCTFTLDNVTPTIGHDVKVRYSAASDYLFGGTLLQAEAEIVSPSRVLWHCTATGYAWLLGQFIVQRSFTNTSINTIVATLLADYTDGDFSPGYCPFDDRVTVEFSGVTIPDALSQLVSLAPTSGAWWEVTPDKRVNLCATYPDASLSLENSSAAHALRYTADLTQVRTRTKVVGVETTVRATVSPGATSISVAEIGWFQPSTIAASSGEAIAGANELAYTGTTSDTGLASVTYGPGTLTGVTGVTDAIAEGERIAVLYTYNDTGAQTAIAAVLGSPSTGVITHWITDSSLSLVACKARAEADVSQYGAAVSAIDFDSGARHVRIGRVVAASITSPITISGNYQIQQVVTTPRGRVNGTTVDLNKAISAGATATRADSILARVN